SSQPDQMNSESEELLRSPAFATLTGSKTLQEPEQHCTRDENRSDHFPEQRVRARPLPSSRDTPCLERQGTPGLCKVFLNRNPVLLTFTKQVDSGNSAQPDRQLQATPDVTRPGTQWQEKKDEENDLRSQKTDTLISVLPGIPVYRSSESLSDWWLMPRLDDHPWSGPCAKGAKHRSHLRASARGLEAKVGEMINSPVSGPSPLVAHSARGTDPAHGPASAGVGGHGGSGHINSWHHHWVQRSLVLFSVGVVLALVLNLLQVQRNVTLFPEEVIATIFSSAWWVPPCCGTAAAVVGLLYPCIDSHLGEPHKFKREWASVMRCVAVFVGINHASAVSFSGCAVQRSFLCYTLKVSLLLMSIYHIIRQLNHLLQSILFQSTLLSLLSAIFRMVLGVLSVRFRKQLPPGTEWTSLFCPFSGSICWILRVPFVNSLYISTLHPSTKLDFANNVQLSLTLAALSLGLWWTFDRSRSGLGLGITIAFLATVITQLLVYNGVYQYTSPDFLYIRSWLPCIFFSGGVTVGNIGRQLAMIGLTVQVTPGKQFTCFRVAGWEDDHLC
ncbi:hypothetical protein E2I00_008047, partial [Balaenoptera physalus]